MVNLISFCSSKNSAVGTFTLSISKFTKITAVHYRMKIDYRFYTSDESFQGHRQFIYNAVITDYRATE